MKISGWNMLSYTSVKTEYITVNETCNSVKRSMSKGIMYEDCI